MSVTSYKWRQDYSDFKHAFDYETYDRALADWCRSIFVIDGYRIPIVFATPERVFAQVRKRLKAPVDQPIPLPIISIQQTGSVVPDSKRKLHPINQMDIGVGLGEGGELEEVYRIPQPKPYVFSYSINLWTRERGEARILVRQYLEQFDLTDMTYLIVDHGYPVGVQYVPLFHEGVQDNTDLEPGTEERTLRWTCILRIEGWVSPPVNKVKVVHRIHVDVNHLDTQEQIDSWRPLVKGNPQTGQIVQDNQEWDEPYTGPDFRKYKYQFLP